MTTLPASPFRGCGTALITPFRSDLSVDEAALRHIVRFQIAEGIHFLVPGGTTGETPTLSHEEHRRVVAIALEERQAASRPVPILAGAGGNNTAGVCPFARELEALGADGILSVAPYYNKPTQEGLYQHFAAIANAVRIPVVLYNVPGRTSSNIEPATVARLAAIPNIIGIKEASGSINQIGDVIAAVPSDFLVLSGDDAMTLPLMVLGGQGLVSVASNAIPGPMSALVQAALLGNWQEARRLHFHWLPLLQANFIESSPIPVKAVMAHLGLCQEVYRLPMVPLQAANREKLMAVVERLKVTVPATIRG